MEVLKPIKVSVRLMTYNHEKFIAECLDSIYSQELNFNIEIVVGDDFSTDETLQVVKQYGDTEKISLKILDRTRGDDYDLKRKKYGRLYNFSNIVENCMGEYVALIDGDDFWTDSKKLKKQVGFLEDNLKFSACFSNAIVVDEQSNYLEDYKLYKKKVFDLEHTIKGSGSLYPTAGLLFRNFINPFPKFFNEGRAGDRALAMLLAMQGPIGLIDEKMCAYRKHEGGVFTSILQDYEKRKEIDLSNIKLLNDFDQYTDYVHNKTVKEAISTRAFISLLRNNKSLKQDFKDELFLKLRVLDILRLVKNKLR